MKYGTVPIVRATGGLKDTVEEYDASSGKGTGFMFDSYSPEALMQSIDRALTYYERQPHWDAMRTNAMSVDYSSRRCALSYISIFDTARERRRLP